MFHNCGWNDPWWKLQTDRIFMSSVPTGDFVWPALGTHIWKLWLLLEMGLNSGVTLLDPSVAYIPYVASCLFTFVVPEPDICVYSHIPFLCCLFSLTMFLGWKNFTVALPLFSFLGESAQSNLSCTALSLQSALPMLCEYLNCVVFFMLGGYSTRFSQCVCKSTPFSEVEVGFYSILFRFLLLAPTHWSA